ncbi:MAG: hypothetical protein IPM29_11415 [Planctomycetes bacterium]|nr:hypothetical protein [Planctomycetota bacterium]
MVECNLGCTATGCSITDIAPNQPLTFTFSSEIDPRSVDFSSFSIKTATGEEPVGEFFVEGRQVSFLPSVRTRQGAIFFGFTSGATYILTIPAGKSVPNPLTSLSGDRLIAPFSCTVRVSLPVADLNQQPPSAQLVSPPLSQINASPRDINIVLEFNEILDSGPFFNAPVGAEPIQYRIRRAAEVNGQLQCNLTSRIFPLAGATRLSNDIIRSKTLVTFEPFQELPAGSCLEVEVTSRVLDLAGTRAAPQVFRILTEQTTVQEKTRVFTFDNTLLLDTDRSGGTWSNGDATFVTIGGSGKHGDFTPEDGTPGAAANTFVFSTDDQVIARKDSGLLNADARVTDGVFEFSTMIVRPGVTVRFEGDHPARILVRGLCRIQGRLIVNGEQVSGDHDGKNSEPTGGPGGTFLHGPGQVGGRGGAAAGRGGNGAYGCDGTGNPNQPAFNNFVGFDGEDLAVPGTHAYAGQEVGTGGKGAPLFPAHGNQSILIYRGFSGIYAVEATSGGGGGGYRTAGSTGVCTNAGSIQGDPLNTNPAERGAPAPGGISFNILTRPTGVTSSDFYLIGGSGGGGGGSHPPFAQSNPLADPYKFWSGAAGAGGGGAMLLRVGGPFEVATGGSVEARGGACGATVSSFTVAARGVPSPGGGGSGGSLLLQLAGGISQQGTLDVSGGRGGEAFLVGFYNLNIRAGDGAPGMVRVETPGTAPSLASLGTVAPAAVPENAGVLTERDALSGFQTLFVGLTQEFFPPTFKRYEIDATVGTTSMVFSDDPSVGTAALPNSGSALVFYIQGVDIDAVTGQPAANAVPGPWRNYVGDFGIGGGNPGLNSDATLGFRWVLLLDTSVSTNVVVHEVRIVYES